jgi:prepilin-type processing-associated H-X9-DG protein
MTMVTTPAATLMIGDIGSLNDLVTPKPNSFKMVAPDDDEDDPTESRPIARHFSRTNLAFFDGHSKSMQLNQFYGVSNGVGAGFTGNQTPLDLWFCADPSNVASCKISN